MKQKKFSPDFSYLINGSQNSSHETSFASTKIAPTQTTYSTNHPMTPQTAYDSKIVMQNTLDENLIQPVQFDMSTPQEKVERAIADNNWLGVSANLHATLQYARDTLNLQQYMPKRSDGLIDILSHNPDECYAMAISQNDTKFISYDIPTFTSWMHQKHHSSTQTVMSSNSGITPNKAIPSVSDVTQSVEETTEIVAVNRNALMKALKSCSEVAEKEHIAISPNKGRAEARILSANIVSNQYELKEKFLSIVSIISLNGQLCMYNGWYYKAISDKDLEKLLIEFCRNDVEYYGEWKIVREAISFIKAEPSIVVQDEDISNRYVSLKNGILDLDTGKLLPHSPDIITTYGIDAHYLVGQSGAAYSPRFNNFTSRTGEGYPEHRKLVLQFIGYSFTPDTSAKVIFDLQGRSNTGKTVLISFIQMVLSEDSHTTIDVKELSDKFALERLPSKVLLTCPDMTADPLTPKVVSRLKQLSGGDLISSDRKYKDRVVFRCRAKIALITNHPIITKTPDNAFFNRLVTIPFGNVIPKDEMDPKLVENLYKYERDGIVTEAINEYLSMRWDAKRREQLGKGNSYIFAGNFAVNTVVEDDGTKYINVDDLVRDFVQNCIEVNPNERVNTRDAYEAFSRLYGYMGVDLFNKLFNKYIPIYYGEYAIQCRGPKAGASNGPRGFKGITLNQQCDAQSLGAKHS